MKINFIWLFILLSSIQGGSIVQASTCAGRFINPITDICWSCLLPITLGSVEVFSAKLPDTKNPNSPICLCPGFPIPRVGVSLGYWEPSFLVDVSRTPFCLVNLGGLDLNFGNHWPEGMINTVQPFHPTSFYHVHWYIFPLMVWLNLLGDLACQENSDFDLAYLSELDPTWQDEELALLLNPEALLFANHPAQLACGADAIAASSGQLPIDSLFWCAGAQGSYYPLTGFVREHSGAVHASTLLAERMSFKLHRELLAWDSSPNSLCRVKPYPIMPKSRYRYQMTSPVPATQYPKGAQPFGHTTATWGANHSYPGKGEHFGYLIWRKRNCCAM